MSQDLLNLDTIDKYFEFIANGNTYQFWYPTTKESLEFQKILEKEDEILATEKFITEHVKTPENTSYPQFSEVYLALNGKQMNAFKNMIYAELGLDS